MTYFQMRKTNVLTLLCKFELIPLNILNNRIFKNVGNVMDRKTVLIVNKNRRFKRPGLNSNKNVLY